MTTKIFRPGAYRDRLGDYLEATGRRPNAAGNIKCPSGEHEDVNPSCKVYPDGVHCFSCGFHADVYALSSLDLGLPDARGAENWRRTSDHIEKVLGLPSPLGVKLPDGSRTLPVTKSAVYLSLVREKETELERAILALLPALHEGSLDAVKKGEDLLIRLLAWYDIDRVCEEAQHEDF
jgi:hypothetical protein